MRMKRRMWRRKGYEEKSGRKKKKINGELNDFNIIKTMIEGKV